MSKAKRKATAPAIAPPAHLNDAAKRKWGEIVPIIGNRADADQGVLDCAAAYCVAWAAWTDAQNKVNELGPVVKGLSGVAQVNPYVTIAEKALRQMRQFAAELRRR